jgi:3-oxoadipate enol-lactonase
MPLAKINGINIFYKVEGQGEPLVMIMGFGAGHRGWLFQVPYFRKYYQVITFDNRGVGKSDKPPGPYSTGTMAEDTIGLMDNLHIDRAHIMGVSMGGMIAQEIAINHPQRVSKLVLGCTYASRQGASADTKEISEVIQLPSPGMSAGIVSLSLNNPIYQWISRLVVRIAYLFVSTSTKTGLRGQREACNKHNSLDRLHSINAPTLVIAGTKDRIIKPSSADLIASKIPAARLVKVEGGSHTFYMEMRSVFNGEVLKFLQDKR